MSLRVSPGTGYVPADEATSTTTRVGQFDRRPTVTLVADNLTAGEDSSHGAAITFLRTATAGPLPVTYSVSGTAEPGADYQPLAGTVVIPAGQDRVTVWVYPVADGVEESPETLVVTAAPSAHYDLSPSRSVTVTLRDDGVPGLPLGRTNTGPSGLSSHPVRYWDGLVVYTAPDLASAGFGHPWAYTRSWSNLDAYAGDGTNGNRWLDAQPYLVDDFINNRVGVVEDGRNATYFEPVGGGYEPLHFTTKQLTHDSAAGEFVLTDADGNKYRFADFTATEAGRLRKFTDRYGNVTEVT